MLSSKMPSRESGRETPLSQWPKKWSRSMTQIRMGWSISRNSKSCWGISWVWNDDLIYFIGDDWLLCIWNEALLRGSINEFEYFCWYDGWEVRQLFMFFIMLIMNKNKCLLDGYHRSNPKYKFILFPSKWKTPTPKTLPLVLYTSLTSTYPLSTTFPK